MLIILCRLIYWGIGGGFCGILGAIVQNNVLLIVDYKF